MLHAITYRMLKAEKINVVAVLKCAEDFRNTMEIKLRQRVKVGAEKKDGSQKISWNRADKAAGSFTDETKLEQRMAVRLMAFDSAIADAAHAAGDFAVTMPDWCKGLAKLFPAPVKDGEEKKDGVEKDETVTA